MDSNYEWQKFRAKERVQARRQEAELHRQAKEGENGHFDCAQCRRFPSLSPVFSRFQTAWPALKRFLHKKRARSVKRERLV